MGERERGHSRRVEATRPGEIPYPPGLGLRQRSGACITLVSGLVKNKVRLHGVGFEGPKLVCIDVQPYTTTQAPERSDVLNVGGFSDAVFHVVASFLGNGPARFAPEVETIKV